MNPTIAIASRDVLFLDCETSGLNPDVHEILELAAMRLSGDLQTLRAHCEYQTQMQWPERAEAQALATNRYSAAAWRHAVPLRTALVQLLGMIDDDVIVVGHRISFDESFLRVAFAREGLVVAQPRYSIDTVSLAFPLARQGHLTRMNLTAICSKYGIPTTGAHTAMRDVQMNVMAYAAILGLRPPPEAARWR